jgi:hypothetical protein
MQLRAIMLADLEVANFTEAAKIEQKLSEILEEFSNSNKCVSYTALNIKERRGSAKPDLEQMAFRQNKPSK